MGRFFFVGVLDIFLSSCSRYKKFKEAEFFNELTGFCVLSLRVYLFFCKYYREEVFIVAVLDTKN